MEIKHAAGMFMLLYKLWIDFEALNNKPPPGVNLLSPTHYYTSKGRKAAAITELYDDLSPHL